MKNSITVVIDGKQIEVQIPDRLLRDFFAGLALAATNWPEWELRHGLYDEIAVKCFNKAEAMMRRRKAPRP